MPNYQDFIAEFRREVAEAKTAAERMGASAVAYQKEANGAVASSHKSRLAAGKATVSADDYRRQVGREVAAAGHFYRDAAEIRHAATRGQVEADRFGAAAQQLRKIVNDASGRRPDLVRRLTPTYCVSQDDEDDSHISHEHQEPKNVKMAVEWRLNSKRR